MTNLVGILLVLLIRMVQLVTRIEEVLRHLTVVLNGYMLCE